MDTNLEPLKKPRKRLRLPPDGAVLAAPKSRSNRLKIAENDHSLPGVGFDKALSSVTPEILAYSLPGGLAKLAYKDWSYAPHLRYIEDVVLQMQEGKSIYIMFSTPPRHGKTLFISRTLPAWYLGRNPDKRVLLITYQQEFSRTQSRAARNLFKSYGKQVFGLEVADDTGAANHWDIANHEGGMEAVGAGGAITGKGADLLICDDLVKGFEEAMSPTLLEKRWEWFLTDVYSRLEPGSSAIIVMTRWTNLDIIGRIEQEQKDDDNEEAPFDDWQTISFPALATENDILGRKPGEALFPKRFPAERLRRIKAVQDTVKGSFWFESLYQGNPVPFKGDVIDIDWFSTRYDKPLPREEYEMVIVSADTASKETDLADFTVLGVWGVKDMKYYLLDVIRGKMEYPQLKETALSMRMWKPDLFLIEDKGSGIALLQDLYQEGGLQVMPMNPGTESKVLRMSVETPVLRTHRVVLPEQASWLEDFLMECRSFPRGKKDQVDMMSQFLKFMRLNSGGVQMW